MYISGVIKILLERIFPIFFQHNRIHKYETESRQKIYNNLLYDI